MTNPWLNEFWRIVIIGTVGLVLGLIFDNVLAGLLIALTLYFSYYIYNLYRLERWLSTRDTTSPPEAPGIWGDVFYHIYKLQRRNRKRKKKLASMLSRFQESTAAMPDATLVLNASNEIEWFNRAAKKLLALKTKEDIGQRIENLVRSPVFVKYLIKGEFGQPLEMHSPLDPKTRLSIGLVGYGKNQKLVIVRDITRLHQLETMRRDFVANVSHELKTPLTVIAGYLENLLDETDEKLSSWKSILDQMQQQGLRMQQIVDDLLLLSRLETEDEMPSSNPVAVPAVITTIVEELKPLTEQRNQNIELECADEVWLQGNEKELYSAFSNLVVNAIKYTPDGGNVTIRWGMRDNNPVFTVSDSGIGIHPDHLARLTERFYRVDAGRSRDQGGTGLGLAIVKHVLIRHNAILNVESKLAKGSCFSCVFDEKRALIKQNQNNIHAL